MYDMQNESTEIKIPLKRVGISNYDFPITLQDKKNKSQKTVAQVSMFVDLPKDVKGTHMSRFIEILNNNAHIVFNLKRTDILLKQMKKKFGCQRAHIELTAPYFLTKKAPVTKMESLFKIEIQFKYVSNNEKTQQILGIKVPVTSLCPCSKKISKYGAHNQRSFISLEVILKKFIWIEELVEIIERNSSSPIYPLLKRPDEKFVTEYAYEHPTFVEDLIRKISSDLIKDKRVSWFKVNAESQESIHTHNAFAMYEHGKRLFI